VLLEVVFLSESSPMLQDSDEVSQAKSPKDLELSLI
jgi:hypothetical protein